MYLPVSVCRDLHSWIISHFYSSSALPAPPKFISAAPEAADPTVEPAGLFDSASQNEAEVMATDTSTGGGNTGETLAAGTVVPMSPTKPPPPAK